MPPSHLLVPGFARLVEHCCALDEEALREALSSGQRRWLALHIVDEPGAEPAFAAENPDPDAANSPDPGQARTSAVGRGSDSSERVG